MPKVASKSDRRPRNGNMQHVVGSKSVTITGAGNTTVFESITASSGGTGGAGMASGGNSGTATGNGVTQYQNSGGSSRGSGGGAGGAYSTGASGGSGILIIRYTGSYNIVDGSIFYETDNNKEYVLYNNTWTEV